MTPEQRAHDDTRAVVVRRREARRQTASVLVLTTILFAGGAALAPFLLRLPPAVDAISIPWWALALMFAAAEFVVMHLQYKREAVTISLSELPLMVALFFATPLELLGGRLVGVILVYVLHRRCSPLKTAFNAALVVAETMAAVGVFHLVWSGVDVLGPLAWAAAASGVAAEQVVAVLAINRVIAVYEGAQRPRDLLKEVGEQLVLSAMVVVVGLVAVASLVQDARNAALLAAAALVVLLAYRSYTALFDRHLSLERMYGFSQVVISSPEVEEILRSVLTEAQQLLRAERVEVVLLPGQSTSVPVRVALDDDGVLHRGRVDQVIEEQWLQDRTVDHAKATIIPRGTRDPAECSYLDRRGWREAVIAPLRGSTGVLGALTVADRMGEVRPFDSQDLILLETVANHAAVAVQNGRLIDKLRHEALHDALTGLPNRVMLRETLETVLGAVRVRRDRRAAVLIIDLDGFKDVNDTLGHAQGDRLLVEIARRLRTAVGRLGTVARLGGDEFAVLLPDCGDEDSAVRLARRLLHALGEPIDLDGCDITVGASIGIAVAPTHATDGTTLLRRADVAMYDAKESTAGYRLFEPSMDSSNERRLTLVNELRQALSADGLTVHVQPQAMLRTHHVGAVEALVRWEHPELGSITPTEFIPVAERSGQIGALTSFVLERSVAACATWRAAGHEVAVSVNLSTRCLLDTELVDEVRRVLRRHDLPGRLLTLEITEGGVMADPARAVAVLLELRELGVRLSVDDFGTGYSSLSYLKRLPVHEVKIDRSFITDLVAQSEDAAIVRSIVDLGCHLGLDVVAEGIEDEETWQLLDTMGCTQGQGWYLSRPMPIADFAGWIEARRAASAAAEVRLRVVR